MATQICLQCCIHRLLFGARGDCHAGYCILAVKLQSQKSEQHLQIDRLSLQGGVFVDFDSMPEETITLDMAVSYLMSCKATSLRNILLEEAISAGDILLRQSVSCPFLRERSRQLRIIHDHSILITFDSERTRDSTRATCPTRLFI